MEAADKAAAKSRKTAKELLMDGLVRPVAMPFQLVGSGARVASLEALVCDSAGLAVMMLTNKDSSRNMTN